MIKKYQKQIVKFKDNSQSLNFLFFFLVLWCFGRLETLLLYFGFLFFYSFPQVQKISALKSKYTKARSGFRVKFSNEIEPIQIKSNVRVFKPKENRQKIGIKNSNIRVESEQVLNKFGEGNLFNTENCQFVDIIYFVQAGNEDHSMDLCSLSTCALIDPDLPAAVDTQVVPKPPPPPLCFVQTSTWRIFNYPISGNTVQFQFQIRSDCKHYFKVTSPCTRYEAEYTTTHDWVGSPSYTIDAVSLPWVNLITCTSGLAAILEGNVVYHFYPPPKSGWYHIFLAPAPAKLNWGGYVATWVAGPQKVWFS